MYKQHHELGFRPHASGRKLTPIVGRRLDTNDFVEVGLSNPPIVRIPSYNTILYSPSNIFSFSICRGRKAKAPASRSHLYLAATISHVARMVEHDAAPAPDTTSELIRKVSRASQQAREPVARRDLESLLRFCRQRQLRAPPEHRARARVKQNLRKHKDDSELDRLCRFADDELKRQNMLMLKEWNQTVRQMNAAGANRPQPHPAEKPASNQASASPSKRPVPPLRGTKPPKKPSTRRRLDQLISTILARLSKKKQLKAPRKPAPIRLRKDSAERLSQRLQRSLKQEIAPAKKPSGISVRESLQLFPTGPGTETFHSRRAQDVDERKSARSFLSERIRKILDESMAQGTTRQKEKEEKIRQNVRAKLAWMLEKKRKLRKPPEKRARSCPGPRAKTRRQRSLSGSAGEHVDKTPFSIGELLFGSKSGGSVSNLAAILAQDKAYGMAKRRERLARFRAATSKFYIRRMYLTQQISRQTYTSGRRQIEEWHRHEREEVRDVKAGVIGCWRKAVDTVDEVDRSARRIQRLMLEGKLEAHSDPEDEQVLDLELGRDGAKTDSEM